MRVRISFLKKLLAYIKKCWSPSNPAFSNPSSPTSKRSFGENPFPANNMCPSDVITPSDANLTNTSNLEAVGLDEPQSSTLVNDTNASSVIPPQTSSDVGTLDVGTETRLIASNIRADPLATRSSSARSTNAVIDAIALANSQNSVLLENTNKSPTGSMVVAESGENRTIEATLIHLRELLDSAKKDVEMDHFQAAMTSLQEVLNNGTDLDESRARLQYHLIISLLTRYGLCRWIEDLDMCILCLGSFLESVADFGNQSSAETVAEIQVAVQLIQECRSSIDIEATSTVIRIAKETVSSHSNNGSIAPSAHLHIILGNALVLKYLYLGPAGATELDEAATAYLAAERISTDHGYVSLRYISLTSLAHIGWLQFIECGEIDGLLLAEEYLERAHASDEEGRTLFEVGTSLGTNSADDTQMQEAIALLGSSLLHRTPPHPRFLFSLDHLSFALFTRFRKLGDLQDLEECIGFQREALNLRPSTHPNRSLSLNNLGDALLTRFNQTGSFQDLEECIILHREALTLRPVPHPNRPSSLTNLASALAIRFEQLGSVQDLEESVILHREALDLQPPNAHLALHNLAAALLIRFRQNGALKDLEECILLDREALTVLPMLHPDRPSSLNNLANALSARFEQRGVFRDLEECIALHTEALDLRPNPHPDRSLALSSLAAALATKFQQTGTLEDLEECITLHREALTLRPAPHPYRSLSLDNLATALSERFRQKGEFQDLEECIALYQEALELRPKPHPNHPLSLNNLASALSTRFQQKGEIQDLEECVILHREALDLLPSSHPSRPATLSNQANVLFIRFQQTGLFQDLEECTQLHREALSLRPVPHPDRSSSLAHLASTLSTRFEQKGAFQDLEECIALHRQALSLLPMQHPDRYLALNNLAAALLIHFEQRKILTVLDECFALQQEALTLLPATHTHRSPSLNNLANFLIARFEHKGAFEDLEECISLQRESLNLRPAPHPDRSSTLNNLASALWTRFQVKGVFQDLKECIILHQEALGLRPAPHPTRSTSLNNLANALVVYSAQRKEEVSEGFLDSNSDFPLSFDNFARTLFPQFEYDPDDAIVEIALHCYEEASKYETGSLLERLKSSKHWAVCAQKHRPALALDAYHYAVKLLPLLASMDLTLAQRQDVLQHSRDLVGDAAKFAITVNKCEVAVVFLSTGRSIFWSQALELRTPVDQLMDAHPSLAKRFTTSSRRLEHASYSSFHPSSAIAQQTHKNLSTLADQRHIIIGEIQKLPGFEGFLAPPSFPFLQAAASKGPIIFLNASEPGCDALIMHRAGPVQHVALPGIHISELQELGMLIHAMSSGGIRSGDISSKTWDRLRVLLGRDMIRDTLDSSSEDTFRLVLELIWVKVVGPVVSALRIKKSDPPTRIWWCPTGPFSFLPVHAAGIYSVENVPVDCLFQYAVSSYCTSPQDLLHPEPPITEDFKMTVIIEPEAPAVAALPATRKELKEIERHIPNHERHLLVHVGSKNDPAKIEELLSDIQQSSFTHFGCHGTQNLTNPLESYLLLSGGKLTMSKIIQECQVPEGALAYLSACETAKGDEVRPDESLNLAASMMFVGFRSVVGTMWSILDEDAPVVAGNFYRHLFRNGMDSLTNVADAAYGLHLATKELRDQGKSFNSWVPYVHYGI